MLYLKGIHFKVPFIMWIYMCFYYVCTQYLQNKQHGLGDQLSLYQITLGINVPTSKNRNKLNFYGILSTFL